MIDQTVGPVLRRAVAGKTRDDDKAAAVLGLNVVDPAVGSDHFLVAATEYIARFWKRRVAQSCIYSVDLNPLAVEAKLLLWLVTVAMDRPLSFLDHHLRCGNALIGMRIVDLNVGGGAPKKASKKAQQSVAAGQLSMLDDVFRQSMSTAVSSMWLIEGSADNTVNEVKQQERIYAELRDTLTRKYQQLADLATATRFALTVDPALWQPLADFATGRTLAAPPKFSEWLDASAQLAAAQRFFH